MTRSSAGQVVLSVVGIKPSRFPHAISFAVLKYLPRKNRLMYVHVCRKSSTSYAKENGKHLSCV